MGPICRAWKHWPGVTQAAPWCADKGSVDQQSAPGQLLLVLLREIEQVRGVQRPVWRRMHDVHDLPCTMKPHYWGCLTGWEDDMF